MSKNQSNSHTTFLRSQSYIVNGQPNPLSNISRIKYFSKYANLSNEKNKKMKKNKNYIYLIKKKQKKQKKQNFSLNKANKQAFIKQNNKNIQEEYKDFETEPYNYKSPRYPMNYNKEEKDIKNYTEINLNEFINDSFKEKYNIKKEKENNNEMFHKNKNNFHNKVPIRKIEIPYYNLTEVTQKKDISINNLSKIKKNNKKGENLKDLKEKYCNQYYFTTGNIKDSNKIYFSDLNKKNINLFSNTKKLEFSSKHKSLDKNIDSLYNSAYSQKKKKNKKVTFSTYKDKSYINKILSNNDDDCIFINGINNNKLLSKLNHYTRREKYSYNPNTKNVTKDLLKLLKKYLNTEIASYKSSTSKINEIPRSKNIMNYYDSMSSSIKNYINFNNSIKNLSKYSQLRNNNFCLISSENNNINSKKDLFKNELKDEFGQNLSNIIKKIRDERKTKNFIKEFKINNKSTKSQKGIRFSFSQEKNERNEYLNDEFYSPLIYNNRLLLESLDKMKSKNIVKKNNSYDIFKSKNHWNFLNL